jgi:hypothetical protein
VIISEFLSKKMRGKKQPKGKPCKTFAKNEIKFNKKIKQEKPEIKRGRSEFPACLFVSIHKKHLKDLCVLHGLKN